MMQFERYPQEKDGLGEFRWPLDKITTLEALAEAIAGCGVQQREADHFHPAAEALCYGVRFDAQTAAAGRAALMEYMAGTLYARLANVKHIERWVWRVNPEVDEQLVYRYLDASGAEVDPILYWGDHPESAPPEYNGLTIVDTGLRVTKCYCRFWLEII